jgi:hypothetical protein
VVVCVPEKVARCNLKGLGRDEGTQPGGGLFGLQGEGRVEGFSSCENSTWLCSFV